MSCPHNRKVGDNYGETCMDCGEVLSGYGEWGSSNICKHKFEDEYPGSENEICIYCFITRKKVEQ